MSHRILVVDDDRAMVETLCDVLGLHGWETVSCFDGESAVQLAAAHDVDVVLMDVRMPRMNGVEALRSIRRQKPSTSVILMTAYAAQELLSSAERDGALRILSKPVELPQLLHLLEEAATQGRSVLVVDDDTSFLLTLCDSLAASGLRTTHASDLTEALAILEHDSPRAVLLHLKLDALDPHANLLAIRRVDPSVLLILYSGHSTELADTMDESRGLVDASFMKPLPIEDLVALLNSRARH